MNIETNAVQCAIRGAVPERLIELEDFWSRYAPYCHVQEDRPGFYIEAGPFGLVLFTHRTMLHVWLLGFVAQKAFFSYSGIIQYCRVNRTPIDLAQISSLAGQSQVNAEIDSILDNIIELSKSETLDEFGWPNGVPRPEGGKPKDVHGQMFFDLACMASAFIFLHEVRHIQFRTDGHEELNRVQEELECDKFAIGFMLDQAREYAQTQSLDANLVETKRAMSIGLACLLPLVVANPETWYGTRTHPPVQMRIQTLVDKASFPDNDWLWNYLSSISLALLHFHNREVPLLRPKSDKQLFLDLVACI